MVGCSSRSSGSWNGVLYWLTSPPRRRLPPLLFCCLYLSTISCFLRIKPLSKEPPLISDCSVSGSGACIGTVSPSTYFSIFGKSMDSWLSNDEKYSHSLNNFSCDFRKARQVFSTKLLKRPTSFFYDFIIYYVLMSGASALYQRQMCSLSVQVAGLILINHRNGASR